VLNHIFGSVKAKIFTLPAVTLGRRVLRSPILSSPARMKLLLAMGSSGPGGYTAVPVPGGKVFVGRQSPLIDATTVLDVWEGDMFPADCAGRVVLDLGAHKGYFGAWALAQGARAVMSCEPHPENFGALRRSHSSNVRRVSWQIERVAVGPGAGRATLFSSKESWAHSLYPDMVDAKDSEEVTMVGLASLLHRARAQWPGFPVVLKLNIEGAAGDALLPVPPADLAPVVEVHLDHEPGSPHPADRILHHLARAGLTQVYVQQDRLYRVLRPADSGSGVQPPAS
jgi:FkbM family methyltransferase